MPSSPYDFTHADMVLAVATGSLSAEVGASVAPRTETIILIPAAAYWDLIVERSAALRVVHSYALSQAPAVSRNDKALLKI